MSPREKLCVGTGSYPWLAARINAPASRIIRLLVERVTITGEGIAVDLRTAGLGSVVRDMLVRRPAETVV